MKCCVQLMTMRFTSQMKLLSPSIMDVGIMSFKYYSDFYHAQSQLVQLGTLTRILSIFHKVLTTIYIALAISIKLLML